MSTLVLIGAGLDGSLQLTDESKIAIRSSRVVFYSSFNFEKAPTELHPAAIWKNVDDSRYRFGCFRPRMYEQMAQEIVMGAVMYEQAAVLQPGSAMVLDAITRSCRIIARRVGVEVKIVAGISSCETILAQLQTDTSAGLQIVTAQTALLRRTTLNRELNTIILQPGYYDTLYWAGIDHSKGIDYRPLRDYLSGQLGGSRPAFLVRSSCRAGDGSTLCFSLRFLEKHAAEITPYHSIVVPAARAPVRDRDFQLRLRTSNPEVR